MSNLSISNKSIDTVLVLDFGSQYTQLIARRIRESNVYSEILPWDIDENKIKKINPVGIILSGGQCPQQFAEQNARLQNPTVFGSEEFPG